MTVPRATTERRRYGLDYREPLLEKAEEHRKQAESLIRGMEVLTRKFSALEVVPLDLLDRAERIAVAFHVSNLERVSRVSDTALAALEVERS